MRVGQRPQKASVRGRGGAGLGLPVFSSGMQKVEDEKNANRAFPFFNRIKCLLVNECCLPYTCIVLFLFVFLSLLSLFDCYSYSSTDLTVGKGVNCTVEGFIPPTVFWNKYRAIRKHDTAAAAKRARVPSTRPAISYKYSPAARDNVYGLYFCSRVLFTRRRITCTSYSSNT